MIPLSTTTVSILRLKPGTENDEPYAGPEPHNRDVVAIGVRAVISYPTGQVQFEGGQQNVARYTCVIDPTDVHYTDLIQDEQTGRYFKIAWLMDYIGDHVEIGLYDTEGEV